MQKPVAQFRSEMHQHSTEMIRQFAQIIFANLAAMRRLKAKGYSDKHPAMQFLQRERIAAMKHIEELRGEPW